MPRRPNTPVRTLVRTGRRVGRAAARLPALFALARALRPDGFPAEETRELAEVRARIPLRLALELRAEVAATLGIAARAMRLRLLTVQACGPVSLHDDKFRYPGVYFAIVVAHAGRLGIVDHRARAAAHVPGEILVLDPYRRHGLVPVGSTAAEHPYERTHSPVHEPGDQFLFLCFDVKRPRLRGRLRNASETGAAHRSARRGLSFSG